ncbi:hypothetical protein BCV69DRAFT_118023 [Microstroma glucosiphilum]|uniref:Uncharacterized protein n=1 Tax=Pseudomicrostroma glucosiphilum TaxID=1684307 RepID=A0A316UG98_9BASI|nr:hypothetical protein BCV69DRAFT_118023 [Pseudomicrostroma glucosiphilum]PWN23391.1 hypothetical protein BCV69DRAFT_118023 [Pseudomicrostroma glucosiphilum]
MASMFSQRDIAIDDTSLLLLIGIIALLLVSALLTRWHQPTLHPLILGRQADATKVHQEGESAVYRNANSPHGFDLAARPRKGANDVTTLLTLGSKGGEAKHKRKVYGKDLTNEDILNASKKFGTGLQKIVGGGAGDQAALAISVEVDHIEALQALLAGELLRDSSSGRTPFSTLVIPPLHLPQGQPEQFPVSGKTDKLAAVYTTSKAIRKAAAMSIATSETLYILRDQQEVAEAEKALQTNGGKLPRMVSFHEVLDQGSDTSSPAEAGAESSSRGGSIQSSFWLGSAWTQVSNQSLCAGVTAYLSFYPADKIPTTADRIWVEQSPFVKSPSLHLGAAATPAGLALALTALYTGSSLQAAPLTSSIDDPNPATSAALVNFKPTLIYASPNGASSLGLALTSKSKRSPFGGTVYQRKLLALRRGTLDRSSIWDSFLFNSVRSSTGTDQTRGVNIVGRGWVVGQSLLDVLRGHLGCPVVNSFLPDGPLESRGGQSGGALSSAWLTAPIASSHSYDVQAFQANNRISEMPAHVGPPSVSVEIKLVKDGEDAKTPHGWERFKGPGDVIGQVLVRGTTLTTNGTEGQGDPGNVEGGTWYSTGSSGLFRSNGTLLLLPPSIHAEKREMAPLPTMSSKYPVKGGRKIGTGDDEDEEQTAGKKKGE